VQQVSEEEPNDPKEYDDNENDHYPENQVGTDRGKVDGHFYPFT
jgi:hypothetical protein